MRQQEIKIDLLIHDLKVPLAVIEAGITSLLKRPEKNGPLTDKQEEVLTRVLRNTKMTQNIVNDALELGRSGKGIVNLTNFRLSTLVEQALVEIFDLENCSTSKIIRRCNDLTRLREALGKEGLMLSVDESLWCREVCLDKAKVKQILRNLLNNALKYRKNLIALEIQEEDSFIVFSLEDDGEGIPSHYHAQIFEQYFQLDVSDSYTVRGHGLGLAGVMLLVEDMGGKLLLESDTGKGARFLVKVPLNRNK